MNIIRNFRFLYKKKFLKLKYRYKYWILFKARVHKEKEILSGLRYINNKTVPAGKITTPPKKKELLSTNRASQMSLKKEIIIKTEFIKNMVLLPALKPIKSRIFLLSLILFNVIFILILFSQSPDYDGKFIKQISKEDKVCKFLLEDIKDFKEKCNGKGGVSSGPDLKVVLYKIKKGERLWDIHKKTGLSMDTLISMNHQKNIHILQPGQVVHIPNKDGIAYQIQEGESLESIAEEFKVDKSDILDVNDLDESSIKEGMDVFIPNGKYTLEDRINILGRFLRPLYGRISSGFGPRRNPFTGKKGFHYGIDIANVTGARVRAAESGRVIFCGTRKGYGKLIIIKHSGMYSTRYGHLSRYAVKHGQRVRQGQVIGYVGSTGHVTGSHLHFEIRKYGRAINPYFIMRCVK